jgi:hypothetical protein
MSDEYRHKIDTTVKPSEPAGDPPPTLIPQRARDHWQIVACVVALIVVAAAIAVVIYRG